MENTRGRGRPSRRGVKLRKRSTIWQHFEETDGNDGSVKCRYCFQVFGPKSQGGNLKRHYERQCPARPEAAAAVEAPPPAQPQSVSSEREHVMEVDESMEVDEQAAAVTSPMPPCAPSGSGRSRDREPVLEQQEACRDLARMIALGGHDPSILEDDYFRSFVRRLNPGFKVPSLRDTEELCDGILDQEREDLRSTMWDMTGHPSMAVGKATTVQGEVMYATCHFIGDEWKLHRVVTDASMLVPNPPLRGPLLGACEVNLAGLSGYDEDDDDFRHDFILNATDGVMDSAEGRRIFMIAYGVTSDPSINNLVSDEITDVHSNALIIPELFCTAYMDNVLHSIARCLSSVAQLHDIYSRVRDLVMTRREREELLSDCGLENLWAYEEPWYSCYCSLQVLRTKASSTPTYIEHMLCKLWGTIYHALRTISTSRSATSHLCLGEWFHVWESFKSEIAHTPNDESTEQALKDANHTLDEALRNYYLVWSIPLVLDPQKKLKSVELIFKSVLGPYSYQYSKVEGTIKKLYSSYKNSYDEDSNDNAMAAGDADPWQQDAELNRYLEDEPVPNTEGFDILNWWKDHGSVRYPRVARMARDALAMPTCSKLSANQLAQVRSRLRGYSLEEYPYFWDSELVEEEA